MRPPPSSRDVMRARAGRGRISPGVIGQGQLPEVPQEHMRRDTRASPCDPDLRWVWSTFHGFQWDLHYSNPQVSTPWPWNRCSRTTRAHRFCAWMRWRSSGSSRGARASPSPGSTTCWARSGFPPRARDRAWPGRRPHPAGVLAGHEHRGRPLSYLGNGVGQRSSRVPPWSRSAPTIPTSSDIGGPPGAARCCAWPTSATGPSSSRERPSVSSSPQPRPSTRMRRWTFSGHPHGGPPIPLTARERRP